MIFSVIGAGKCPYSTPYIPCFFSMFHFCPYSTILIRVYLCYRGLALLNETTESCEDAYFGLLTIIQAKPSILLSEDGNTIAFLQTCLSWDDPPQNEMIQHGLHELLMYIRQSSEEKWKILLRNMGKEKRLKLYDNFKLTN